MMVHGKKQQIEVKLPGSVYETYSHWGIIKHGVSQGLVLGTGHFLIYITELPATMNSA
jgi:hypothetical protein